MSTRVTLRRSHVLGVLVVALVSGSAGAEPEYAELSDGLSDGRQLEVCGQLLEHPPPEDLEPTPLRTLFADGEQGGGDLELSLQDRLGPLLGVPMTTGRGGGFCVSTRLDPPLPPATYQVRWRDPRGAIKSGRGRLRVLPSDYRGVIVTSDIDLTYLQTPMGSARGIARLIAGDAHVREPVPGMPQLYRALRAGLEGGTPLLFLSGSPTFFRSVLERRLVLDGIGHDGMLLKPYGQVVLDRLRSGHLSGLVDALKDQIPYKLSRLLRQRQLYPVSAREILMGDDTEADPVVLSLYQQIIQHRMGPKALEMRLRQLGVDPERTATLSRAARAVQATLGPQRARVDVYIRRYQPAEPGADEPPVIWHRDTYQLALALYERGDLSAEGVRAVGRQLGSGAGGDTRRARSAEWARAHGLISKARLEGLDPLRHAGQRPTGTRS